MSTRAEEIAAEGPYRVEKSSNVWVIMGPQGRWPFHFSHESTAKVRADDFNRVYKQGQQDRWISVEDQKPDHDGDVLVSTIYKYRGIGVYSEGYWYPNIEPGHDQPEGVVTHWMPLPPNPKQP